MDFIETLMKEIVEEVSKGIPEDVLADLKELSRLQAYVHRCLMENKIIDTGKIKRINELVAKHYYNGEAHEQTKDAAKPETFDFGEAIRRMKKGTRVARKGWNEKGQYIVLGRNIRCIIFVGPQGELNGWLASQADMLAEDWYELKGEPDNA